MGRKSGCKARMWSTRVAAFEASGQRRRAWCAAQGVNIHTLDYWRLKLRRRGSSPRKAARPEKQPHQPSATAIALVPVEVRSGSTPTPCASSTAVELELPNGLRVRTALSADAGALTALVRALWPC